MSSIDVSAAGADDSLDIWDFDAQTQERAFVPDGMQDQYGSSVDLPLHQRIAYTENETYRYSTVDGLVNVEGFSLAFREPKVDFWQGRRLVAGITTLVGTAALGAAAVAGSFPPVVLGALGVSAVATLAFGSYRTYQAHRQVGLWQRDPAELVAHMRREAYEIGLKGIYIKDSGEVKAHSFAFGQVLSEAELHGLYLDYLSQIASDMSLAGATRKKVALLKSAAKYGALRYDMMDFACLPAYEREKLALYVQEHDKFVQAFDRSERMLRAKIYEVKRKAREQISVVANRKGAALSVVRATYNLYESHAKSKLDKSLQTAKSEQARLAAHQEYQRATSQARGVRDMGLSLVAAPFDVQIGYIRRDRDAYVRDIKRDRDGHLLSLFGSIASLYDEAYKVATGQQAPRATLESRQAYYQFPAYDFAYSFAEPSFPDVFAGQRSQYDSAVFDDMLRFYEQAAH